MSKEIEELRERIEEFIDQTGVFELEPGPDEDLIFSALDALEAREEVEHPQSVDAEEYFHDFWSDPKNLTSGNMLIDSVKFAKSYASHKTKALTAEIERLRSALEDAITGLEWWMETYPESESQADYEKIAEFRQLLNKHSK